MVEPKWNLAKAITTIIDSGVTATDLSHDLGFQDTAMIYRYKNGVTKSMGHSKALVIYESFSMLLDCYDSADQLYKLADAEQKRSGKEIDSCGHIMDKLIVIASYKGADLRQKLLKFIASNDRRI